MPDWDDVRRIASRLEGAEETDTGFRVNGRSFVHQWRERVDPRRAKVPRPDVAVIGVDGLIDKDALIATDARVFFTEPHYDGYASILVRLTEVGAGELDTLITDSWRLARDQPPPRRRGH